MPSTELLDITQGSSELNTPEREQFAILFATHPNYFGNGTDAYIQAYDVDRSRPNYRAIAQSSASRLLTDGIVLARINFLLETRLGLNDTFVDKQLAFIITQSADLRSKLAGIKEYNTLKGRIKKKIELSFTDTPDTELDDELEEIEKELQQAQALLASRRASKADTRSGMPNLTDAQEETIKDLT